MKAEIKKYRNLIKTSEKFRHFVKEFSKGFDIRGNYSYILTKFNEYKELNK